MRAVLFDWDGTLADTSEAAAGVASVAIRGSYPNVEALLASRPDFLADSLKDAVRYVLG